MNKWHANQHSHWMVERVYFRSPKPETPETFCFVSETMNYGDRCATALTSQHYTATKTERSTIHTDHQATQKQLGITFILWIPQHLPRRSDRNESNGPVRERAHTAASNLLAATWIDLSKNAQRLCRPPRAEWIVPAINCRCRRCHLSNTFC